MKEFIAGFGKLIVVTLIAHIVITSVFVLVTYEYPYDPNNAWNLSMWEMILLCLLIGGIFYVPASLGVVLVLYFTRIFKKAFSSKLIQCVIFFLVILLVQLLTLARNKLPNDVKYYTISGSTHRYVWFEDSMILLYSCLIVILSFGIYEFFRLQFGRSKATGKSA